MSGQSGRGSTPKFEAGERVAESDRAARTPAAGTSSGARPPDSLPRSSITSLSRTGHRLWRGGEQPKIPWIVQEGFAPAVRARGPQDALAFVDSHRPEIADAVRSAIPPQSLEIIEATIRTGWIDAEHDRYVPGAIVSVLGPEAAYSMFGEFLPSQLEGPIFGRMVSGVVRLVGRDPGRFAKLIPRGWSTMFRDMGEFDLTERGDDFVVLEQTNVPESVVEWEPYALSWAGFFTGLIAAGGREGDTTWATDIGKRRTSFTMRWS